MNTRPCALITRTSAPVFGLEQAGALAGRALRKIERPEQPVVALDEHQRLALIEHMIARRHHVGAGIEQLDQDRLGDAETAGRVLAVHHHEIERVALAELGQMLDDGDASGSADHISKKQHAHECSRSASCRRIFPGGQYKVAARAASVLALWRRKRLAAGSLEGRGKATMAVGALIPVSLQ